jgi:hypothetical protein
MRASLLNWSRSPAPQHQRLYALVMDEARGIAEELSAWAESTTKSHVRFFYRFLDRLGMHREIIVPSTIGDDEVLEFVQDQLRAQLGAKVHVYARMSFAMSVR